jgi:hypothetical protein
MDLDQYIIIIKEKLASSPIVAFTEIVDERVLLNRGYFRARLALTNTDFLEIAESFTIQDEQLLRLDYRYQWMDAFKPLRNAGIVSSIFQAYQIFLIIFTLLQSPTLNLDYPKIL